jgi:hypothetical protein
LKKSVVLLLLIATLASCTTRVPTPSDAPVTAPPTVSASPEVAPSPTLEPFTLGEKFTRRYDEPVFELIPSDDYGELYPYVGKLGSSHWNVRLYGLCTAEGEIVCDPVFGNFERLEYEGDVIYLLRVPDGSTVVAAVDGSFALTFGKANDVGEGRVAVFDGERWGALDYRGNLALPLIYENRMWFSEGLASVTEDFAAGYRYVDGRNNTVIADMPPFPKAMIEPIFMNYDFYYEYYENKTIDYETFLARVRETVMSEFAFSDGMSPYIDGDKLGYIDRTGAIAIPARFDVANNFYERFQDGTAILRTKEGNTLIDKTGAELIPPENSYIYQTYELITVISDDNSRVRFYDNAGNLVRDFPNLGYDQHVSYVGDGWFEIYTPTEDYYSSEIQMDKDGVIHDFADSDGRKPRYVTMFHDYNRIVLEYVNSDYNTTAVLADFDGNVYYTAYDNYIYVQGIQDDAPYFTIFTYTDITDYNSAVTQYFDFDGNEIPNPEEIPGIDRSKFTELYPIGDLYQARTRRHIGLINAEGEWAIKISTLAAYPD